MNRIIPPNAVRIFYNEDCGKWGVEVFDRGTSSGILGWRQVDTTELGARDVYTRYKGVAKRWEELFRTYGKLID